mmetsp:Transcript_113030/g.359076  ORF Transcript_113030/g.359076 Transcript_113030/m.359076 type:complete len:283 (-) Transcript_113030:528-1376(-)
MQPTCMQHHLRICRRLEGWRRHAARSHHEFRESVAAVTLGILLQKRERLVLHLRAAVALDELELELALLVLEHQTLHGGSCVVAAHLGDGHRPLARLLVQLRRHEHGNEVVCQPDLDHLLEARIKPDEAAALCTNLTIDLQLKLVETSVALRVHLLLEINAIRAVHLHQDLLDRGPSLHWVTGVIQVSSALATSTMDALEQALLVGVHVGDGLHEASDALLLRDGILQIDSRVLLREHNEGRSRSTHLRADALKANLLQGLAGHRLRARPDQAQRIDGPGGF